MFRRSDQKIVLDFEYIVSVYKDSLYVLDKRDGREVHSYVMLRQCKMTIMWFIVGLMKVWK